MKSPTDVLREFWGHDSFRPVQEEIIHSVLQGNDTLALLPTGGGKSVCYQIPALLKEGSCLVISPLIALMNDQIFQLKKRGIPAIAITSAMTFPEIESAFNQAIHHPCKLIYVSPERIQSKKFLRKLPLLKINLVAVDESHCISQWGYDFRPSYLKIKSIREELPNVPFLALTATATALTTADIIEKLGFNPGYQTFRASFFRKNLHYRFEKEEKKERALLETIRRLEPKCAIIYCRSRAETERLSELLSKEGFASVFYHAGLSPSERAKRQHDWNAHLKPFIVCTNAFGMGIDKPDVDLVLHFDLPDSIESWFQEAGRGGRDGRTAQAIVLYNEFDIEKLKRQQETAFPAPIDIQRVYLSLCNYFQIAVGSGEGLSLPFSADVFAKKYNFSPSMVFYSIKFLEKENYVAEVETGYQPSRLHIAASALELYNFRIQNPALDYFIQSLLRLYGGLFSEYVPIQEAKIGRATKKPDYEVKNLLLNLQNLNLLHYIPQNGLPSLLFVRDRIAENFFSIKKENYDFLKATAEKRLKAMMSLVHEEYVCRNRRILSYFDESDFTDCQTCDICLRKIPLPEKEQSLLRLQILNLLSDRKMTTTEMLSLMYHFKKSEVIDTLHQLAEEKRITIDAEKFISIL